MKFFTAKDLQDSSLCEGDLAGLGEKDVIARASEIAEVDGHPRFTLHLGKEQARLTLGLAGMHQTANALAAASVASLLGVSLTEIVAELEHSQPGSPHRMDVREVEQVLVIDDAYNANPTSMRAGIAALGALGAKYQRRVAVLGQMLELGTASDQEHQQLLEPLLAARVTDLVLVGSGAFALTELAREKGINVVEYFTVDSLLDELPAVVQPNCAVLFKGSNGTRVWQAADTIFSKGLNR